MAKVGQDMAKVGQDMAKVGQEINACLACSCTHMSVKLQVHHGRDKAHSCTILDNRHKGYVKNLYAYNVASNEVLVFLAYNLQVI
jgi:hypothetical protein